MPDDVFRLWLVMICVLGVSGERGQHRGWCHWLLTCGRCWSEPNAASAPEFLLFSTRSNNGLDYIYCHGILLQVKHTSCSSQMLLLQKQKAVCWCWMLDHCGKSTLLTHLLA
jgi:hypothetical protein